MSDNKGRLWKASNSSLAYQLICNGDEPSCMKWLGYAQGMLAGLLGRSNGSTSLNCSPMGGVDVEINTRPNSIKITAGSVSSVYMAPMLYQIPDNTLMTGVTPFNATTVGYWNSFVGKQAYLDVNGNTQTIQTDVPVVDSGTIYAYSASSTLDKTLDVTTGLSGTKYGSRGYADEYLNNNWTGKNNLSVNASVKLFKDEPTYLAVLGSSDKRSRNYIALSKFVTGIYLYAPHQVVAALGVYIGSVFYVFPSDLTTVSGTPNLSTTYSFVSAAARPTSNVLLTAVASEDQNNGTVGAGSASQTGFSKIVVGMSTLNTPVAVESFKLAGGNPVKVATSANLTVKGSATVDILAIPGGYGSVRFLQFSPDAKFLYVGMYWSTVSGTSGNENQVSFMIQRWCVGSSGVLSISSPVTVYISPNYLVTHTIVGGYGQYNYSYPTGGFRVQITNDGRHIIGFCRVDSVSNIGHIGEYTSLLLVSMVVDANPSLPTATNISSITETYLEKKYTPYYPVGHAYYPVGNFYDSNGIYFADYINNTYIYGLFDDTYRFKDAPPPPDVDTSHLYHKPALWANGVRTVMDIQSYLMQGLGITTGYNAFNPFSFGLSDSPMIHNMFGNRCALSTDGKYVYMFGLRDKTSNSTGGAHNNLKVVLAKIKVSDGSYTVIDSPTQWISKYIVTSMV